MSGLEAGQGCFTGGRSARGQSPVNLLKVYVFHTIKGDPAR